MGSEGIEREYRAYLNTLSLSALRVLGRRKGVAKATAAKKEVLVEDIVAILTGRKTPKVPSKKGAPIKQDYLDPAIERRLSEIKNYAALGSGAPLQPEKGVAPVPSASSPKGMLHVESPGAEHELPLMTGILEMTGEDGYIHTENCRPSPSDAFVNHVTVAAYHLKNGDRISGRFSKTKQGKYELAEISAVNGRAVGSYEARVDFSALTPCYPQHKLNLSYGANFFPLRLVDLFAPIGKGQRALLAAPPQAGKSTFLRAAAASLSRGHGDVKTTVLLLDVRPEEVTETIASIGNAELYYSTIDEAPARHIALASLVLDSLKRRAEEGEHCVLLLDSLTNLYRAYAMIYQGDPGIALYEAQRFFGAARALQEGGSLTVITSLEMENERDEVLYEGLRNVYNALLWFSPPKSALRGQGVPALDLRRSGTRRAELLMGKEELSLSAALRERNLGEEALVALFRETQSNEELLERFLAGKLL